MGSKSGMMVRIGQQNSKTENANFNFWKVEVIKSEK